MIPEITLGWRLRIALDRGGIKADEMARALGVHRGTITRWTHDIGKPPRPVYLEKWAALCGVSYEWLVGDALDLQRHGGNVVGASSTSQGTRPDTREYRSPAMAA